ncbi:MAG: saccharopine dehydrogenase C-terminal domain-containing protein [Candidatus Aminicenantales bacterium]
MPKFLVLGAGKMGVALARDLISSSPKNWVTLVDVNSDHLKKAQNFIRSERLITLQRNVEDSAQMDELFQGHDVAVAALLHKHSLMALEAAVRNGVHLVDVVGEKPLERLAYGNKAEEKNITVIPGCGLAPGIDNICVGRGVRLLEETERAIIYVGGNPLKPKPPLKYNVLYAAESLLSFYQRKAFVLRKGRVKEVEPLSGIETVSFPPPFLNMECFYTDGLSSLLYSMKGKIKKELAEKTVRYPGHARVVRMLKRCGFFSREPIQVGKQKVIPLEFTAAFLESKYALGEEGDVTLMRVEVSGKKSGESRTHVFELLDFYDPETRTTSMARSTAFPASIAAQMIASGEISQRGVVFPEDVFQGSLFKPFVRELKKRGIAIKHRVEKG